MGKAPNIFYRGQRIWKAVMEDLLENGMKNAHKVFTYFPKLYLFNDEERDWRLTYRGKEAFTWGHTAGFLDRLLSRRACLNPAL